MIRFKNGEYMDSIEDKIGMVCNAYLRVNSCSDNTSPIFSPHRASIIIIYS